MKEVTLKKIAVICKGSNGKCYELNLKDKEKEAIIALIQNMSGSIKVFPKELELEIK